MHRSLTLSEIVSSTLSNDHNNNAELDYEYSRDKFITNIGIGLIELLFSSLLLCHGILFAGELEDETFTVENGLWTTILYISTYHICAPWSKRLVGEWYDSKGNQQCIFRLIVFISTCLSTFGVFSHNFTACYGVCGGFAHRIVSTQVRWIASRKFKMEEQKIECNVQPAKAICLLILPHLLLLLVDNYTISQSFLIYATFLLNVIPASWIIRYSNEDSEISEDYPAMSRYQTLSVFSRQMEEMKEFSEYPQTNTPVFRIGAFDTPSMEDNEENDENQKDLSMNDAGLDQFFSGPDFNNDEESLLKFPLTHQTVQIYYSNMGVNILPNIPEEPELDTEKDVESSMKNTIDPKRLSKISAALRELIQNGGEDKESEDQVLTTDVLVEVSAVDIPDEIKSIEYIHDMNSNDNRTAFRDFDYSRYKCCQFSPYTIFKWRCRYRCLRDFIADYFLRPLCYTFKDLYFYPTLVSKVVTLLISTIFITLAPYLFLKKNSDYKKEDTAFLLSYMAFSWCLFLVFLPLVITFSKVKMRYTFILGLLFTAFSMLLLSKKKMTNDLITWSCLLYGFGFGMLSYTENFVYKSFLNETRRSEGTLDILSGISVILAFYSIFSRKLDIVSIFPEVAFYCYVIVAGFWTIPSFMKICIIPCKEYRKT